MVIKSSVGKQSKTGGKKKSSKKPFYFYNKEQNFRIEEFEEDERQPLLKVAIVSHYIMK